MLLQKAEEFLRTSVRAERKGDRDAAMLASIHAAMTANDAVCVALLKKKNLVEYEARRASAAEARDALERATRFVSWARDVVGKASP